MARPDNWVPLNKRDHINILWIAAICLNQLTCNFIWTPVGALTNPYCKKLGLNNVATTFVQLIGSFVGISIPPFVAVWSDTTTLKLGRRRPWMIGAEILVMAGLMMISFCREMAGNKNGPAIAIFVIGQIFASVGGNSLNGPGRSMCSDVVPETQQVLVSNICSLYNGVAGVISNLIGALKLYQYTPYNNETLVLMISCIIGGVSFIISVCATPEEPLLEKPETTNPVVLIIQSFKDLTKQTLLVNVGCFFYTLGSTMFDWQNANFIAQVVFKGDPLAPPESDLYKTYDNGISHSQLLALIQTVVQVAYSAVNTSIVNFIGLRNAWIVGMVFCTVGNIVFFFNTNKWFYLIGYISLGIAKVVSTSVPYAMISIIAPAEKLAGAITNIIFFNNIGALVCQFGLSMGLGSIQWFIVNPGRIIGLSFIFCVCGLVCGIFGYTTNGKEVSFNDFSEDNENSDSDRPNSL